MNAPKVVKPSWGYIGAETLQRFRADFHLYFPAAVLASLFAFLCIYLLEWIKGPLVIGNTLNRITNPSHFVVPWALLAQGRNLISLIEWWIVWMVFSFMLASVAMRLLDERQASDSRPGIGKAFRLVRSRRAGALIGISACAGGATAIFSIFLLPLLRLPFEFALYRLAWANHYFIPQEWVPGALTLLFAAWLAKMTLAVPELVDDQGVSIGQAIRNSIKATAGWEVFFFLEFSILGLVCGTFYFAGKNMLESGWKHGQLTATGYEWMLTALIALLAGLALALLALAHSLIYVSIRYGTVTPSVKAADSGA